MGKYLVFSLCPWIRILVPNVRLCMVISVAYLFTAPTGKTGPPDLRFIVNLRLFLRIFTLDLLEEVLASVRCLLPGGISAELVPVLVFDEETELLRRELLCSLFWRCWATIQKSALSSLIAESMAALHTPTSASFICPGQFLKKTWSSALRRYSYWKWLHLIYCTTFCSAYYQV